MPVLFRFVSVKRSFISAFFVAAFSLLISNLQADQKSFRFAWLSDTHIGGGTSEQDLRSSVADINSQTGLSFVIVSGDVTQYGFEEQYRLAKSIFDQLRVPCHIIPGNHDFKWSDNAGTLFPRIFGDERFVFDVGGYRFIGMHQGPVLKMGDGHFAPQDVRWLDQTLAEAKDRPIIFVTHYPLDDGIDNWFVVLERLKKVNTQAVLVGHGHSNRPMNYEGVPAAMGRSNLRADKPVGGYTLGEIKNGVLKLTERVPGKTGRKPWHSIRLEKHNYAADTNQWPRPDFSVNTQFPNVTQSWQRDVQWTIASSPALAGELLIVGDASGEVRALSLERGEQKWVFKTGGPVYSTPDVAEDRVVFASTDGCVYALNAKRGTKIWQVETRMPSVGVPYITNGIVYIGASDDTFRALDLETGKTAWEFKKLSGFVEARPLVYEGKVIFGAWDAKLYALDQKTGRLAWSWIGENKSDLYSPAACWPAGANGKVFIVAPDRKMTAIEVATGKQIWRTGKWMVRETIGIAEDRSRVYVRTMQDKIAALSTTAAEPQPVWEIDAGFGYDINSAMIVEKDGVVFYGTKNGLLYALDAKTGAVQWKHRLGASIVNTVLPLSAREVITTDFDGKITRLKQN